MPTDAPSPDAGAPSTSPPPSLHVIVTQDVPFLAPGDAVTALAASERAVVVGTARGAVHVLDVDGNEVGLWGQGNERRGHMQRERERE